MKKAPKWIVYWLVILLVVFSPYSVRGQGIPSPGNDMGLCNVLVFDGAAFKGVGVYLAFMAAGGVVMPLAFAFFAAGAIAFDYMAKTQHC